MRKILALVTMVILLVTVSMTAFAAQSGWSFTDEAPGFSGTTAVTNKDSANGVAAQVKPESQSGRWIYRVRKAADGVFVTNQLRFPSTGPWHSVAYNKDGNGMTLGRQNYSYKLNIAHYSQDTVDGSSSGKFVP